MLETRGKVIQNTKTLLEKESFNLPADIWELKFYDASNPLALKTPNQQQETNQRNIL